MGTGETGLQISWRRMLLRASRGRRSDHLPVFVVHVQEHDHGGVRGRDAEFCRRRDIFLIIAWW